MNWKKRVGLSIISIPLLFLIISCKGQTFEKSDIRLLSESNKSYEINKSNGSEVKFIKENLFESTEKVVVDKNRSVVETNEFKLAELQAKLIKEKEIVLAKLESQEKVSMAKLESQKSLSKEQKELEKIKSLNNKEVALAKIQSQKDISKNEEKIALSRAVGDKEIALAKLKNERELADKNIAFYKMIAMMVVGLIVLLLLIVYFINSRKRKNELKIHEDELRHKEYMEASRQHNEHIGKMLDVIIDENADTGVKKEIVRLLKDQGKKGNLIEHKR